MDIRKTLIIITGVIILLLFGLVSSISYKTGMNYGVKNAETIRNDRAKTAEIHTQKIKSVLVSKVQNSKVKNKINSSGRVVSLNNITITSEVQGRLIGKNKFKKGTEIKEGDIIFSVKDTDLKLLLDAKKTNLIALVSATIPDIQLDFKSEHMKWEEFLSAINFNDPLPEFPKMNSTQEKNYIISRSILAEYLSIRSDEERLKKYNVLAPFDGIITKSYSDIGGNVNPGSPIVDFIRKNGMEIELTVNRSEIEFIKLGNQVDLTENGKKYSGKITRKGRFVNPQTQNISVFTSINTKPQSIYNGMYLDAVITTEVERDVFKLTRSAIFDENKVFTIGANKKLEIHEVNIIAYQGDEVIIDNLENNTLIVNEPLVNVKEGTIVKPIIK